MKIGVNLLLWTTHVEEKHFHLFPLLKQAGFDGVEIPLTKGTRKHYSHIKQVLKNEGLECTATTNGSTEHNLISNNAKIRQAGLDHIYWAIDCCDALGSNILGGPIHSAPGIFSGKAPTQKELSWAAQNLTLAVEAAEKANTILCLEVLNRFECYLMNTVAQAKRITDIINSQYMGIHYDTHHAHIEEGSIKEAIHHGGKSIKHVHFSESHRGILGTGQVNWQETIKQLKSIGYNDWITLEAFTTKVAGLAQALHITRPLITDEIDCCIKAVTFIRKHWNLKHV